ncbi:MAG: condensation domain-containing protein [Nostoc sp. DedQUE05]|uniref:condensation domain-containing protein n=1 Tax=Nostoc sp. DedQUE05 TaxID=3075391 RepID=UPI002AD36A7E|nr:condensation domain-containing protein [Nostoc sp. DedQUE05]MDZ8091518.1 condensation domain-containing protein [Nostoc sp. DedQUE05]
MSTAGATWQWPLSSAQRRIWILHELDPKRLDHLVTISLELNGTVEVDSLTKAWAEVFAHHSILRMRVSIEEGDPIAVVDVDSDVVMPYLDLVHIPPTVHERLLNERLNKLRGEPMNLETGPITRTLLIRREEHLYHLELIVHHIACDGWSVALLVDELLSAYLQIRKHKQPERRKSSFYYADYVRWEREVESLRWDEMESRIIQRLLPLPEELHLPVEPRYWDEYQDGDEIILPINKDLTCELQRARIASRETSLTLGLSALGILLARLTGQDDMLVSVPLANRPAPEHELIIGDFVNIGLVRINLHNTNNLQELIRRVSAETAYLLETQSFPFDRLLTRLRSQGYPLDALARRVAFTVQNFPRTQKPPEDAGFSLLWHEPPERQSKFDLVFTLDEDPYMPSLIVTFRPSFFRKETIETWAKQYLAALSNLARVLNANTKEI